MLVENVIGNFRLKDFFARLVEGKGKKGRWLDFIQSLQRCVHLDAFSVFSKNFSKTRRTSVEYLFR